MAVNNTSNESHRRRELAKKLHPDAGGNAEAFASAFAEHRRSWSTRPVVVVFKRPNRAKHLTRQLLKRLRRSRRRTHIDLN